MTNKRSEPIYAVCMDENGTLLIAVHEFVKDGAYMWRRIPLVKDAFKSNFRLFDTRKCKVRREDWMRDFYFFKHEQLRKAQQYANH